MGGDFTENTAGKSRIILVTLDNTETLRLIKRELVRSGYAVKTAKTLTEAKERLTGEPPDLILLDNELPDGKGIGFLLELRRVLKVPVIMLTSGGRDEKIAAVEAGCDDFIEKPFDVDFVVMDIDRLLDYPDR